MHVLFVEPSFPRYQRDFVRGLASVGAHVTGIGEAPAQTLDGELRSWLGDYVQVPSVTDTGRLHETVRGIQEKGWVDRLESTIEAHILPVAKVREACSIPGTTEQTAFLCRDKPAMKDALREAGVPCAASRGVDTKKDALDFAHEVGYPIIIKPRDAAGASGTYRADDDDDLERIAQEIGLDRGLSVAIEEFIEGHEGFYDTICLEGRPVHDFISHYYPGVLEAMRERWISPQIVTTNRMDVPDYDEVREMGQKVIDALGIGTSATHMEWFFGPKGLKFSEIGCRPPGVGMWDVYAAANDFDIYREWAHVVVHGKPEATLSRQYAAGMIALRPDQDGKIRGYEGIDRIHAAYGENLIDEHLPAPGTPTQGVEAGYMANAWMRLRHPDYDRLREMMNDVGETVKVFAG